MMANPAPAAGAAASAAAGSKPSEAAPVALIGLDFDRAKSEFSVHGNAWGVGLLIAAAAVFVLTRRGVGRQLKTLQVAEVEVDAGPAKVRLRPNDLDRQIAYEVWVELSTRKIGLAIDLENDVIAEVYDSWREFFAVTRDLIKSIPVSRLSDDSTRKIVNLSVDVLNTGLRPHLTQWQARFRGWHEHQLKSRAAYEEPQAVQKRFPAYSELTKSLLEVNAKLMAYRADMHRLVYEA